MIYIVNNWFKKNGYILIINALQYIKDHKIMSRLRLKPILKYITQYINPENLWHWFILQISVFQNETLYKIHKKPSYT